MDMIAEIAGCYYSTPKVVVRGSDVNPERMGSPNSKVHGANMGPIWGRQVPGGPHVGPMKFVIWVVSQIRECRQNMEP